jgi:hypothetical protein
VQNTDGNTDGLCSLVYFRGKGNCFPPPGIVHYTNHWWKYRQFVYVDVFQTRGELFPSTRHCSLCKPSMETPTVCVHRCIPEAKGIVPLLQALFTINNTEGNIDGLCLSLYSKGEGNCSPLLISMMEIT